VTQYLEFIPKTSVSTI